MPRLSVPGAEQLAGRDALLSEVEALWTPPWAAVRAAIGLAALAGGATALAPWLEVYARAEAA